MSEAPCVVPSVLCRPTKALAEFVPRASPVVTLESFEVLRASTEARPPETTPETWPPTAEPVLPLPDWLLVDEFCPFWTLAPLAPFTSAREIAAEASVPVPTRTPTSTNRRTLFIPPTSLLAHPSSPQPASPVHYLTSFSARCSYPP